MTNKLKHRHSKRPIIRLIALALPISIVICLSGCVAPYAPYNDTGYNSSFYGGYYNSTNRYLDQRDNHSDYRQYRRSERDNHREQRRSDSYNRQEHGRSSQRYEGRQNQRNDNNNGGRQNDDQRYCDQQHCDQLNGDQQNTGQQD